MAGPLEIDLDALRKLSPQLQELVDTLIKEADNPAKIPSGDSPSILAARRLVGQVLPGIQRTAAARLANVADVSRQAQNGFADTEEHLRQLMASIATLSRRLP